MSGEQLDINRLQIAGHDEHTTVNAFFVLFKTAHLYEPNNSAYLTQSTRFYDNFRRLSECIGKVAIKIVDGRVMVNENLIQFDIDGLVGATSVLDLWRQLGIGGVELDSRLDSRQLDKFVFLLAKVKSGEHDFESIGLRLKELGLTGIKLLAHEDQEHKLILDSDEKKRLRQAARASFFRSISIVEDNMVATGQEKEIDISKTRRVIHSMIDHIMHDESYMLQLTVLRDFDEYTYAHSTNVCIYALTMGIRLGFDRKLLSMLGFAALFHDLGKVKLPEDLIRKPDVFDENDWRQMQKHPELGSKTILRNLAFNEYAARAAVAAYQHHINDDFTGYPNLMNKKAIDLLSKIISIADTFDALSSGRIYLKRSFTPDEVLKKMMYQMTVKFDAFLLKMFVNIIGVYPAGTLVLLSSGELAVVAQNNPDNLSRPQVSIIGDRSGPYYEYKEVDLAGTDNSALGISKIIDPQKYNIDMKAVLFADA